MAWRFGWVGLSLSCAAWSGDLRSGRLRHWRDATDLGSISVVFPRLRDRGIEPM